MKIQVYTDGSSRGNPGRGGWGCLLLSSAGEYEWGGREDYTTNNRMEMTAVYQALLVSSRVSLACTSLEILSDSEYTIKGITSWIKGWKQKGWKTSAKKDVLNKDLWMMLDAQLTMAREAGIEVSFTHVRGHAGVVHNERVDVIATSFADATQMHLKNTFPERYGI